MIGSRRTAGALLAATAVFWGAAGCQNAAQSHRERVRIRQEIDYVTVNVRNSNGSISQVRLRKEGIGYVGARGEYYDHLPADDQLRPVYGF